MGGAGIVNFISFSSSDRDFNNLKNRYIGSTIQIWVSSLDKRLYKIWSENIKNMFYPYCIGILDGKVYIIFRKFRVPYDVLECFERYYDNNNIGKNALILSPQVLQSFKTNVEYADEISGKITYRPLVVNSNFSWKYVDKLDDDFKIGDSDSASVVYDKITFHTHPIPTYLIKNVKVAWPSVDDYMAINHIYRQQKITVYHLVISKEGLYIVVCKGDIPETSIRKDMDIRYSLENIYLFLERINNVSDKIQTRFYTWNNPRNVFLL